MIGVVVSRADRASEHIGEQLLDIASWDDREDPQRPDGAGGGTYYRREGLALRTFDDLHLDLTRAAEAFEDPDLVAFASRHSGETGPLLTAHFTGNFGPADYGGEAGALARACPNAQRAALAALDRHAPEAYDVGVECTHHGPTDVGAPSMFVELGSGEAQWDDPAGARAVARALLDLAGADPDRREAGGTRHVVGFGGGHYAPRFERVLRETDWAVGHVAADWALDAMGSPDANREVLSSAFEASAADRALVEGRPAVAEVLSEMGYRVVGETYLHETTGVPLALVDAVESDLGRIDEGVRFGAHDDVADYRVGALPVELVDADAAREAVAAHTVAHGTVEGGTRPAGRAAFPDADARDRLVAALADVLREAHDEVRREGDEVVVRSVGFDPSKARERGVPEGPAFGRLAGGEAVEVDGERVTPAEVSSERVERYRVARRASDAEGER